MIGLLSSETPCLTLPKLTVAYRGGRDEVIAGPHWGWRSRVLRFTFRITESGGSRLFAGLVGTLNLRRPLERSIRRVGLPAGVRVDVRQSPLCDFGLSSRTLTVVFSTAAPWERPLPSGRVLWDATPLTIHKLQILIRTVAEGALQN